MNPYETPHTGLEDPRPKLARQSNLGRIVCGSLAWGGLLFSFLAFVFCIVSNQDPSRLSGVETAGWWALGLGFVFSVTACLWTLGNVIVEKWILPRKLRR